MVRSSTLPSPAIVARIWATYQDKIVVNLVCRINDNSFRSPKDARSTTRGSPAVAHSAGQLSELTVAYEQAVTALKTRGYLTAAQANPLDTPRQPPKPDRRADYWRFPRPVSTSRRRPGPLVARASGAV
jgi:hypothetical protein